MRLRASQPAGGDAGGRNHRKNAEKLFYILRLTEISVKCLYLFLFILHLQDLAQVFIFRFSQAFEIFDGGKIQVLLESRFILIQKRQCLFVGDLSDFLQVPAYLFQLPALQIRLEGQMLCIAEQTFDGLLLFPQRQCILIFFQKLRQLPGPADLMVFIFFQRPLKNRLVFDPLILFPDIQEGLLYKPCISQTDHREGDIFSLLVGNGLQLFHHRVNRVVVVGCQKHCLLIKKCGNDGIEDGM